MDILFKLALYWANLQIVGLPMAEAAKAAAPWWIGLFLLVGLVGSSLLVWWIAGIASRVSTWKQVVGSRPAQNAGSRSAPRVSRW